MALLSTVLDWLQTLPKPALLAGTGVLMAGESVVGLGFLIPGEAALLIAAATVDSVPSFLLLWTVTTVGALVGNVIGFALGRRMGSALRESRLIRKRGAQGWDRSTALLRKHGVWAVFFGRLIPFVRSFVPAVAGTADLPFRAFLPAATAGAAVATALPILFGAAVGAGVKHAETIIVILVAAVLLALVVNAVVRARRKKALAEGAGQDPGLETTS